MDHRPNSKTQTRKLLEGNIEENGDGALVGMERTCQKHHQINAQSMKEIIDNLDFIKVKNFCSVKDNVKENENTSH